jgi:outer membrane protein OmpA-like peptidoglycan-associated protein
MDRDEAEPAVTKGVFGVFLLLILIAGLAFPITRLLTADPADSQSGSAAASPAPTEELEPPSEPEPVPETTAPASTPSTPPTTTRPTTTRPPETSEPAYVSVFETKEPSGLFDPDDPTRRAVLKAGVVYLGGEIRSALDADTIAVKVAQIVGPDNVYMEYRVNPAAPVSNEGILEVADLVLFESGSANLRSEFTPLLDLGVALMATNPKVTIFVRAHTDTDGPAPDNLALSELRAQAIVNYWIASGIEGDRVTGEGKGETQPIADESEPGGAQLNRRAEFVVRGLLD